MKNIKLLVNLCWLTILTGGISFKAFAQCELPNIVISADVTMENENLEMTEDQQIIVTNGATLTMRGCVVTQKDGCSGNWDGIYLVTTENGKSGIVLEDGTKVLFSKKGIQALEGWKTITLRNAVMSDNGQMINARDPWPFGPIGQGLRFGGSEPSAEYIPCEYFTPPSKVIISEQSALSVSQVSNSLNDPPKLLRQISVLGGELTVSNSDITNGQNNYAVAAINSSIGKCRIYGSTIDGFWTGVYKGSDASAHCISEGLLLTGSHIVNTQWISLFNAPGFAVYNISSNAFIKGNVLEGNVTSTGISYGALMENNIYYADNPVVDNTSVWIDSPEESFLIKDNGLFETSMEFSGDNSYTDVMCNEWLDETYAVVAGPDNMFPISWGTAMRSSGNKWDLLKSEMYNLGTSELNYYYLQSEPKEIFFWEDGIVEVATSNANSECTFS